MNTVRVRFAPSPTGPLHIGGVRTALYNYLFAKQHNGVFLLRIEDTDQTRFVPNATNYILEALQWCGIEPTEGPHKQGAFGPYIQSERKEIYQTYIQQLIKLGHAYYAFDTTEELESKRAEQKEIGNPNWQYDAASRNDMRNSITLTDDETQKLIDSGSPYTIRVKIDPDQQINFNDLIRGSISVNSNVLDDKVLFKSDGLPTYHFANIVDDHLMEISHVIRGEEWLPSTALHTLLYQYFGWTAPEFAHLPLILKPDGKGKLSKRDGDQLGFPVFPLNWTNPDGEQYPGYREQGYLPEAFINMLAFLGWNPGTEQEIFSIEELEKTFRLDKVNKSGARFDPEKTKWFQQQHLKALDNGTIFKSIHEQLPKHIDEDKLTKICGLFKERVTFTQQIIQEARYFFETPHKYDDKTVDKKWKTNSKEQLNGLVKLLQEKEEFNAISLEQYFHAYLEETGINLGQLMPIFRLALTGAGTGPQIFEVSEILGKEETISRIKKAIEILG